MYIYLADGGRTGAEAAVWPILAGQSDAESEEADLRDELRWLVPVRLPGRLVMFLPYLTYLISLSEKGFFREAAIKKAASR